ncbi:hypothetical protein RM700_284 [Saccharomyces cerevisiae synthetic construct]|uniref:Putative uncharacterized protein YKR047W n=1 Tax=Saccharomyces cerevisiae (strain ATCC 204508 / S288c) TaxID=559292 RepID=YK27_YEAST|nr:RecName: Full=Putative uncharacterized protein YKR047W [Saccharomyces cerevisiae S288C]AAS56688.1 YKR047W [Saccharomyces cerevisiae]WNV94366.1 hypothetical protein RM700_284 [Saccharomyces cerevisiae synthetic construct]CAA82123.1 unnamed protein product [Saccharomyces cerevisiae]
MRFNIYFSLHTYMYIHIYIYICMYTYVYKYMNTVMTTLAKCVGIMTACIQEPVPACQQNRLALRQIPRRHPPSRDHHLLLRLRPRPLLLRPPRTRIPRLRR